MQFPTQVSFVGLPASPDVERTCERLALRLERFHGRITACRVVLAMPHHRHRQGNLHAVRIHMTVPGGELVVDRAPPEHRTAEDVQVALHEAFRAARRRLEDFARRQDGRTKAHAPPRSLRRVGRPRPARGARPTRARPR